MLSVAVIISVFSLLMIMASASTWLLARSHASTIADLAALAAASRGSCLAAHEVATSNGTTVVDCSWRGSDVIVAVSRPVGSTLVTLPLPPAQATAKAGY